MLPAENVPHTPMHRQITSSLIKQHNIITQQKREENWRRHDEVKRIMDRALSGGVQRDVQEKQRHWEPWLESDTRDLDTRDSTRNKRKRLLVQSRQASMREATESLQQGADTNNTSPPRPRRTLNSRLNHKKSLNRQFIHLLNSQTQSNLLKQNVMSGNIKRILERGELDEGVVASIVVTSADETDAPPQPPVNAMKSLSRAAPSSQLVSKKLTKKGVSQQELNVESSSKIAPPLVQQSSSFLFVGDFSPNEDASNSQPNSASPSRVPQRATHFARFISPSRRALLRSKKSSGSFQRLQSNGITSDQTAGPEYQLALVKQSSSEPQIVVNSPQKTPKKPKRSLSKRMSNNLSSLSAHHHTSFPSLSTTANTLLKPTSDPPISPLAPNEISIRKPERSDADVPQWLQQLQRRQELRLRADDERLKSQYDLIKHQEREIETYALKKEQMLREAPPVYTNEEELAQEQAKREAYLNLTDDVKRLKIDAQKKDKNHLSFNDFQVYCDAFPNGIKFFHTDVVDPKLKIHMEFVETVRKKESSQRYWDGREYHQLSWYREDLKRLSSSQRMTDRYGHLLEGG